MRAYIAKVKEIYDALASCGSPPFTIDGVIVILVDVETQQVIYGQVLPPPMSVHNVQFSKDKPSNGTSSSRALTNTGCGGTNTSTVYMVVNTLVQCPFQSTPWPVIPRLRISMFCSFRLLILVAQKLRFSIAAFVLALTSIMNHN
ncbi:hypothetical protein GQ457_14G020750 [Hibiscus cannabinus]